MMNNSSLLAFIHGQKRKMVYVSQASLPADLKMEINYSVLLSAGDSPHSQPETIASVLQPY
jgi:hypothetical protein